MKENAVNNTIQATAKKRALRKTFMGSVVSNKGEKTIVVAIERRIKHPMYGKFIRKTTRLMAHDEKNSAQVGDFVKLMATRPLSKSKRWRLLEIVKKSQ